MPPAARRSIEAAAKLQDGSAVALDFLHTALTQTRLPYRNPGDTLRVWEHTQGRTTLRVEAGAVADPRTGTFRDVGIPFGEKARLVLIHITGEALKAGSPIIEVEESLTAFVRELGLPSNGRTIATVKDQLARLSAATVRLAYFTDDRASQINARLVSGLDMWAPREVGQRVLWPSTVRLSSEFFTSIQSHAVPLARLAVRALAPSAMALDVYCWLAQRLHRVPQGKPQAVSWEALKGQFGTGFKRDRDFRHAFKDTLRTVLAVYPDAKIEEEVTGLLLNRSRPPVASRVVAQSLPKPAL